MSAFCMAWTTPSSPTRMWIRDSRAWNWVRKRSIDAIVCTVAMKRLMLESVDAPWALALRMPVRIEVPIVPRGGLVR